MGIRKTLWGKQGQQEIYRVTLYNSRVELTVTNLGCTLVSLLVPDKEGNRRNVVLGYENLEEYLTDEFYMGCVVGRFANRISGASFQIKDRVYTLAANEPATGNHLHGGVSGLHKKIFVLAGETENANGASLQLQYKSADGDEGYPGNLDVSITYELTNEDAVRITYVATTDKATPVNLTNHSYFNLSGTDAPATRHELYINADQVLVADAAYIPTGEIATVAGSIFDFTTWRRIDAAIDQLPMGYNVCYVLNPAASKDETAAALRDLQSGISMTVRTSLPGLMLYTGDYLHGHLKKNAGICLETQFFPDSPNRPEFPNTILHPGETYRHQTLYQFSNHPIIS